MSTPPIPPVNTVIGRDCALLSLQGVSAGAAAGTPVSFLGSFEKVSLRIRREKVSIMGAADAADYNRATHFGGGTATVEGFMRGTASSYAAVYASGSHGMLSFQDVLSGDAWQCVVFLGEFGKESGSKTPTKDTLTLDIEGVVFLNGSPLNLD